MAKRGAAVLEMPEPGYAPENGARSRPSARSRRDSVEDFADEYSEREEPRRVARVSAPRSGITVKLRTRLLPGSTAGLIASGIAMLLLLGAVVWLLAVTRSFLLHDARFEIANAAAIEIEGNHHLKRTQVLAVFADDIERNIFGVSLEQRKANLEAMPWVQRATVMRLLPGRLRVMVVERTPVAFVRQGARIGLVDGHGVLLEMNAGTQMEHYSFPVVTGITASDAASTRAARMKVFARFMAELDAGGAKNTESVSEIDLSNPEDVKALVEEHGATVLVHFGEDQFLERFARVKQLLPQWHAQYPHLASADLRYEHEIPLAMAAAVKGPDAAVKDPAGPAVHPVAKVAATPVKAVAPKMVGKPVNIAKPAGVAPAAKQVFVPVPAVSPWQGAGVPANAASVSAAARSGFAAKAAPSPVPETPKAVAAVPKTLAAMPHSAPAGVGTTKQAGLSGNDKQAAGHPLGKHDSPHGKPSAGKPLVPAEANPSQQAAQR